MNILNQLPEALKAHIPLKEVILQAGIASEAKNLCQDLGRITLICDENTQDFVHLAGERVVLPGNQKAELAKAEELAEKTCDYFVAVGSGSLNDIVKYAAYLAKKPYLVFGTAPSMNGYASPNASLLEDGYKKSFAAQAPVNIYLDLEILANAPERLRNSGIGDSICRATVQADILLAKQVTGGKDYAELFKLLKSKEEKIFDDIGALAETLIYGGLAMLLAGSSAPASQGEHMLAHYMELMQPDAPASYHGEQIAVTTVTMAEMQLKLLTDYVEIGAVDEKMVIQHFGEEFGRYCLEQTRKKYAAISGRKIKLDKRAIEAEIIGASELRTKLKSINAPTSPEDIGWKTDIYSDALRYSKYTRDRFTFLDLSY